VFIDLYNLSFVSVVQIVMRVLLDDAINLSYLFCVNSIAT